jgi:hypothetical protein
MRVLLWLSLWASFAFAYDEKSYIPPFMPLEESKWQVEWKSEFLDSINTWNETGTKTSLGSGNAFSRIQSEFIGSFGVTNELQLSGSLRVRQNSATVNNGANEIDKMGLESTSIRLLYHALQMGDFHFSLDLGYRLPLYSNETYGGGDTLVLGDAGEEAHAGLIVSYFEPQYLNSFTTAVTFRNPGASLSSEVLYYLEGALDFKSFALVANYNGILSLNNDGAAGAKPAIENSPSNLYNSKNRELTAAWAALQFKVAQHWRADLKAEAILTGESTDEAKIYSFNLVYRMNERSLVEKEQQRFKEYAFEGEVAKVSGRGIYVVINKGLNVGLHKGMKVDFYRSRIQEKSQYFAKGYILKLSAKKAVVKIERYFYENDIARKGDTFRAGRL